MLDDDEAARISQLEDRVDALEEQVEELLLFRQSMREWAETWGPRVAELRPISLDDAE